MITPTPQQDMIRTEALTLLDRLDALVPSNVAHYAVENARRALRTLADRATAVRTVDWVQPWQYGDMVQSLETSIVYIRGEERWLAAGLNVTKNWSALDEDIDRWLKNRPDGYRPLKRGGKPVG